MESAAAAAKARKARAGGGRKKVTIVSITDDRSQEILWTSFRIHTWKLQMLLSFIMRMLLLNDDVSSSLGLEFRIIDSFLTDIGMKCFSCLFFIIV